MKAKGEKLKSVFKPTKKKVVIIVLILILVIGGISYFNAKAKAAMAAAEPMYNTASVERKDLKKEVSVNGTIGSADKKSVEADITNVEVTAVNVKVGDYVKAGDVICTFDSTSIDNKMENTKESANIAEQKSNQAISDAQKSYNNAVADKNTNASRNAQAVTDTYNGYQTAIAQRDGANIELQAAQQNYDANIEQAKADLATAQGKVETAQSVYNTDNSAANNQALEAANVELSTAQARVDELTKAVSDAQAKLSEMQTNLNTKEAAYKDAVQKQQDTAVTDDRTVAQQDSALDSAKLDAQSVNSGEVAQTIDDLQKQKDACTVVAPIDGTITSLKVEVGEIYKGNEIAVIQNEEELLVNATVDQYTISDITEGMNTIIKTDTTGDLEMQGTLSFVSPVPKSDIDSNGKTTVTTDYEIQADFAEQNERLRLGMNAKTTILIAEAKNVLSVPGSCIQTDGDRKFVTVLVDEATGETKDIDVTTGLETDYDVEVKGKGLEEGMQVIIPDASAEIGTETEDAIYG